MFAFYYNENRINKENKKGTTKAEANKKMGSNLLYSPSKYDWIYVVIVLLILLCIFL